MRVLNLCLFILLGAAVNAQDFQLPERQPELRIVVLGDFNGPYGTVGYGTDVTRVMELLPSFSPDLVLLPGDLIAGQDHSLPDERFSEMWAGFDGSVVQPLRLAGIPFAAAMGNHDASSLRTAAGYTFSRERDSAATYWHGVRDGLGVSEVDMADYPFNFSFSLPGLFVIVWDASSAMITDRQHEWLQQQLAGEAAAAASFRWLVGHLPLAGMAERRDRAGEVIADGARLAAELAGSGLDTYVSGHQAAWYPGELNGLELLMSGGIGGRRLITGDAPVRSTVTVADLWPSTGEVRYTTFDIRSGETVQPSELPARIDAYGGELLLSGRAWDSTTGQR